MTKKFLYGMIAVAGLFAASCQKELPVVDEGDLAMVSLQVSTPEIATRAYSDGTTADVLQYAVYEVQGENDVILAGYPKTTSINITTTVSLQLAVGSTYSVVFWAAADENVPYEVDFKNQSVTVDYDSALSNDETRDAFYSYKKFTVTGSKTEKVELKRPFAQLNIGANDFDKAKEAGLVPVTSSVTVKNVFSTLNLASGVASDQVEVAFLANSIPTEETFPVPGNKYLAMNYLLMNTDKEVVDVEFSYTGDDNVKRTRTIGSVPVQRNHRTNIYGSILTTTIDVNVEIKPGFDGEHDNPGYFIDEDGSVEVFSPQGLAIIAEEIAAGAVGSDVDIALSGDIDLAALVPTTKSAAVANNWTPIGTEANPFTGTFNGNGYTIKNLALVETEAKEGKAYIGFFGYAKDVTIKNVTFENVYINVPCLDIDHSQGHIGAVAGSLEGTSTIENVTVKGDITVYATQTANGASRVAVVAGGNSFGNVTMKNVHVIANEGSSLIANNNTGALAGQLQGKMVFENCSSNIDVTVNKFFAGGLIGIAAADSKFVNCHTTGDVAVVAGRAGRGNDHYRVGGIAGGWADGKTKVCTLDNCAYTGELTGINLDGSVAESFDYMGYVGRGYTLSNCAGSTVTIDGVSFVQASESEYGIYTVDGAYAVNAFTLKWMDKKITAGETFEGTTFKMIENIDLKNTQWSPIGGKETFNGVFDGNGKTISNLKYHFDGEEYFAGLFGCVNNATVKNLTITNVDIKLTGNGTWGHIGAVAGWAEGTSSFEDITVNGDVKIEGEMTENGSQRIGGVVGGNQGGDLTFNNVNVNASEGSYVKGYMQVGGLAGQLQTKASFENCSSNIDVYAQQAFAGGIIGITPKQATLTNCHTTGDISVLAGRAGNANDIQRVGGIVGGWTDNLEYPLVLTGCTFTGDLFAQDANGVEPTEFDYAGFVGRGYTLNGCDGSVVIIDGKEYVQVSPGNYEIR